MKKIFVLLISVLVLMLAACTPTTPPDDDGYKVMITEKEGLTVESANPMTVEEGDNAVFNVSVADNYVVRSVSAGSYDRARGRLTVEKVKKDMRIDFELVKVDFDATEKLKFVFLGEDNDTSSIVPLSWVYAGTEVTVAANDPERMFIGWSVGKTVDNGGEIISDAREFTLMLTPSMANDSGSVLLFANYASAVSYKYDINGGTVNKGSDNYTANEYYTTELSDGVVTVTLKSDYFTKTEVACLFWDDGSFTREGYVLKEYNTKPDGTGESYSLGSKFYIDRMAQAPTLYCIWAEETDSSYFTVTDFNYPIPTDADKAPHWIENGVKITSYSGMDRVVVIPEKIGGKYVTGIAAGAFVDRDVEVLVMGRRMLEIESGAFIGCDELTTIYYPDGIYSIANDSLDAASYTSLKNLYVNATIAPRYAATKDGGFARKLAKLMSTMKQNRIIAVGGSSVYQGLSTAYLEALLEDYSVINFGTTRTTNGLIYYEALSAYTHPGDVVLIAPENSIYMMGESELYYKTIRDIEGMYNLFRYIDISNYTNVFGAFSEFNSQYRYSLSPDAPEDFILHTDINRDGDCVKPDRANYATQIGIRFNSDYLITFNNMVKDTDDKGTISNGGWCDFTLAKYTELMNSAIDGIKATGAGVYFSFAPVEADAIEAAAKSAAALALYDELILSTYTSLDGVLGSSIDYVFNHEYFYDNAYHLNDYGRVLRTYQVYVDLADMLSIDEVKGIFDEGKSFEGCLFESSETPKYTVDFLD